MPGPRQRPAAGRDVRDPVADGELWRRAVAGDAGAFGELFDRHANAIYGFCVRRTGDRNGSEDLVSATFLHAWRRRLEMRPVADTPLPWFYGIAANLARRHLRALGRGRAAVARLADPGVERDPSESVADRLDAARSLERATEVLASLPERDRDLFVLCVWQALSYEEAGDALGIPVGTVRSRLSRARGRLRQALGEPLPSSGDETGERARVRDQRAGWR